MIGNRQKVFIGIVVAITAAVALIALKASWDTRNLGTNLNPSIWLAWLQVFGTFITLGIVIWALWYARAQLGVATQPFDASVKLDPSADDNTTYFIGVETTPGVGQVSSMIVALTWLGKGEIVVEAQDDMHAYMEGREDGWSHPYDVGPLTPNGERDQEGSGEIRYDLRNSIGNLHLTGGDTVPLGTASVRNGQPEMVVWRIDAGFRREWAGIIRLRDLVGSR